MPAIILGCSGSVACIKVKEIVKELMAVYPTWSIIVVPTKKAWYFLPKLACGAVDLTSFGVGSGSEAPLIDTLIVMDPFVKYEEYGFRMADVAAFVIAPIGANLMAKLTYPSDGWREKPDCSNLELLLEQFLQGCSEMSVPKLFLIAPAMNQSMWNASLTSRHLKLLNEVYGKKTNFFVIPTICKASMCGEIGFGCMATPTDIVQHIQSAILHGCLVNCTPDVTDVPTMLFAGDSSEGSRFTAVQSDIIIDLHFQSAARACLPYQRCLCRLLGTLHESGKLDILVGICDETPQRDSLTYDIMLNLIGDFQADLAAIRAVNQPGSSVKAFPVSVKVAVGQQSSLPKFTGDEQQITATLDIQDVFADKDEWELWKQRNDPVLHIVLRQWANILILLDPTPSRLENVLNGVCDDLLGCVVRAWDFRNALLVMYRKCSQRDEMPLDARLHAELEKAGIPVIWLRK